jgi:hypothetical protein
VQCPANSNSTAGSNEVTFNPAQPLNSKPCTLNHGPQTLEPGDGLRVSCGLARPARGSVRTL